jgi:Ankyrin repeat
MQAPADTLLHDLIRVYGGGGTSRPSRQDEMALITNIRKHQSDLLVYDPRTNELPIHIALSLGFKVSTAVVTALLNGCPESVKLTGGEYGRLPLHYAVYSPKPSEDVITLLLTAWNDAFDQLDGRGKLPIEGAIDMHVEIRTINAICNRYTGQERLSQDSTQRLLSLKNDGGHQVDPDRTACRRTISSHPLSIYLKSTPVMSARVVLILIQTYAKILTERSGEYGRLPIHYCCASDCIDRDVIRLLLEGNSDGVVTQDSNGFYPLHIALLKRVRIDIIRMLLGANPASLQHANSNYRLPLHCALAGPELPCIDTIAMLIDMYPYSLSVKDNRGDLPLHVALSNITEEGADGSQRDGRNNTRDQIIRLLVEKYPDGVREANQLKRLPLHLCVSADVPWSLDIVQMLIHHCPDGAKRYDEDRKLPLHYALERAGRLSSAVIEELISAHPESASEKDAYMYKRSGGPK